MTEQEGYVEYGVRCPDGKVYASTRRVDVADSVRAASDSGHDPAFCAGGPHEVVQRTVGPWEVTR